MRTSTRILISVSAALAKKAEFSPLWVLLLSERRNKFPQNHFCVFSLNYKIEKSLSSSFVKVKVFHFLTKTFLFHKVRKEEKKLVCFLRLSMFQFACFAISECQWPQSTAIEADGWKSEKEEKTFNEFMKYFISLYGIESDGNIYQHIHRRKRSRSNLKFLCRARHLLIINVM